MPMAHAERVDFCYWRKQMVVVFLGSLVFIMVMLSLFVTEVPLNGASAPVGFAASAITCSTWWCWMLWLSGAGFFGCLLFIMVPLFIAIVVAVVVALLQRVCLRPHGCEDAPYGPPPRPCGGDVADGSTCASSRLGVEKMPQLR